MNLEGKRKDERGIFFISQHVSSSPEISTFSLCLLPAIAPWVVCLIGSHVFHLLMDL